MPKIIMSHSKDIVHPYLTKKDGPMVVVIPKDLREELNISKGDIFLVKKDGSDKIIYRRVATKKEKIV